MLRSRVDANWSGIIFYFSMFIYLVGKGVSFNIGEFPGPELQAKDGPGQRLGECLSSYPPAGLAEFFKRLHFGHVSPFIAAAKTRLTRRISREAR